MKNIYVQLLNEGVKVYRPVPAVLIKNNIYELQGQHLYDPEDETWEFIPGNHVIIEEQIREGETILVAIAKV